MKSFITLSAICFFLTGCVHSLPTYPGASGSSIQPRDYLNSTCPDLSGNYEAVGHLINGDSRAKQFEKIEFFDNVFPISDGTEWQSVRRKYRVHGEGPLQNIFFPPDFATVSNLGTRSVLITIEYSDAPIGSFHSSYIDSSRFVCHDGRLIWGGKDNINGGSEWGRNTGSQSFAIYKDAEGNLIEERFQQVNMNMLFGIPAGTAEYFSVHQFKKIVR